MKCWNLAYNAQGSRAIIAVVQLGAVKIYEGRIAGGENIKQLRKMERLEEIQFTTKIGVKTSLGPLFCKIFILNYAFDPLLCQNRAFLPPNRVTLEITLLCRTKDSLEKYTDFEECVKLSFYPWWS